MREIKDICKQGNEAGQQNVYDRTQVSFALRAFRSEGGSGSSGSGSGSGTGGGSGGGGVNFLIFGTGHDSKFWTRMNSGGRTVFLEDNPVWVKVDQSLEVYEVKYFSAPMSRYEELPHCGAWLHRPHAAALPSPSSERNSSSSSNAMDGNVTTRRMQPPSSRELRVGGLPPGLLTNTTWDVILVDGPAGWGGDSPGRMAALSLVAELLEQQQRKNPCRRVDVLVHDFERPCESAWSRALFEPLRARLINYNELAPTWHMPKPATPPPSSIFQQAGTAPPLAGMGVDDDFIGMEGGEGGGVASGKGKSSSAATIVAAKQPPKVIPKHRRSLQALQQLEVLPTTNRMAWFRYSSALGMAPAAMVDGAV